MNKKVRTLLLDLSAALLYLSASFSADATDAKSNSKADDGIVVAYVTSWTDVIPDPQFVTHINYAFGNVSEDFSSVGIANPERLEKIASLKKQSPELKVLLSIGGWGSGRFSEMAADSVYRTSFAKDCRRVVDRYGLDGIDIDWEYPTSNAAGISSSPDDTRNFTLLMRDIRKELPEGAVLTLATVAGADYIDFPSILPYIDFVNIMSYDMSGGAEHHAPLYKSENTGNMTTDRAVRAHLAAGVPPSMLTMGIPFYGRGLAPMNRYGDYGRMKIPEGYTEKWDEEAHAPYVVEDTTGKFVFGFENPRSIAEKSAYIKSNGLLGAMYWEYAGDDENNSLRKAVADGVKGVQPRKRILVLNEGGGQHGPFTAAAMKWLHELCESENIAITELRNANPVSKRYLQDFDAVIQLDFPPYTWPDSAQAAFTEYIDKGLGSWIGFHHATLLGDFDGYPMWQWFSDFMGDIKFNNYIAPLADGTVVVEDSNHPVMRNLPASFVIADDEWYTYNRSPRKNVRVLASVDESTYTPASDVKMGDHPVIWTNESKPAKNLYIQVGHSPKLLENENFTTLFKNAVEWAIE